MIVHAATEADIPRLIGMARLIYGDFVKIGDEMMVRLGKAYISSPNFGLFLSENGMIGGALQPPTWDGSRRTIVNFIGCLPGSQPFASVFLARKLLDWTHEKGGVGMVITGKVQVPGDLDVLARRLKGRIIPTYLIGA